MFGGIEFDLVPAVASDGCRGAVRRTHKPEKTWLAGELIVRAERQGLARLPIALWRKTTLQQLVLTGNALTELPPEIGALRQLQRLLLGSNRLSVVPEELCELVCLERLELQDNLLETVPRRLARLVRLQVLNLDGNPLRGRLAGGGPAVGQVWGGRPSDAAADATCSSGDAGRRGIRDASRGPAVEEGGELLRGTNGGTVERKQLQQPGDNAGAAAGEQQPLPERQQAAGEGAAAVVAEGEEGAVVESTREPAVHLEATPEEGAASSKAAAAAMVGETQPATDQPSAASVAVPSSPAAAAAPHSAVCESRRGSSDGGLARRTERFMRYMLALQEPGEALAIKQAKLVLLQEAARARVEGLACTADLEVLAGCQMVAREAALGPEVAALVEAAVAATARLRAASEAGDRLELSEALRAFRDLCRPGHPDGVEFHGAAQKLRDLRRAELERGWRAAAAGQDQEGGGSGGEGAGTTQTVPGEGNSTCPQVSSSPDGEQRPRRVFLTTTELRRRELAAAGALSHEEWVRRKEAAAEQRTARRKAAAAASKTAMREATARRCDRAVEMYELEQRWTGRRV